MQELTKKVVEFWYILFMQGKSVLHFCRGTVFIDGALFFFYNAYFNRGLISSVFLIFTLK